MVADADYPGTPPFGRVDCLYPGFRAFAVHLHIVLNNVARRLSLVARQLFFVIASEAKQSRGGDCFVAKNAPRNDEGWLDLRRLMKPLLITNH